MTSSIRHQHSIFKHGGFEGRAVPKEDLQQAASIMVAGTIPLPRGSVEALLAAQAPAPVAPAERHVCVIATDVLVVGLGEPGERPHSLLGASAQ